MAADGSGRAAPRRAARSAKHGQARAAVGARRQPQDSRTTRSSAKSSCVEPAGSLQRVERRLGHRRPPAGAPRSGAGPRTRRRRSRRSRRPRRPRAPGRPAARRPCSRPNAWASELANTAVGRTGSAQQLLRRPPWPPARSNGTRTSGPGSAPRGRRAPGCQPSSREPGAPDARLAGDQGDGAVPVHGEQVLDDEPGALGRVGSERADAGHRERASSRSTVGRPGSGIDALSAGCMTVATTRPSTPWRGRLSTQLATPSSRTPSELAAMTARPRVAGRRLDRLGEARRRTGSTTLGRIRPTMPVEPTPQGPGRPVGPVVELAHGLAHALRRGRRDGRGPSLRT